MDNFLQHGLENMTDAAPRRASILIIDANDQVRSRLERLTARQTQVLRLIANGRMNKQIALELNISVKTVECHRTQLMDRLKIRDIAGLVRFAIRVGLVRLED